MARRTIIFVGAPEPTEISCDAERLLAEFQQPIANFIGQTKPDETAGSLDSAPSHAVWRSIPLSKSHISTGFSQLHAYGCESKFPGSSQDFFATTTIPSTGSSAETSDADVSRDVLSQFYEHSLAILDDIPSSQLAATYGETTSGGNSDDTSFISDQTSFSASAQSQGGPKDPLGIHGGGHLSDLEDIPPPAYLTSIQPQTMTVNIIVGIISLASPRTVKTRWGGAKTLVEVLVGDETKSGFTVTFWLPSEDVAKSILAGLRTQDVVLMQNVALTVFMGKAYGSSLRKDLTKVHLLYRRRLDSRDVGGYYGSNDLAYSDSAHPQLQKTRKVRDWVLHFVGTREASTRAQPGDRPKLAWHHPPPDDTQ